jgi:hypothetical protein
MERGHAQFENQNQMLIVCMPKIKLLYIWPEGEHIILMSLLYKLYYMEYCLYKKTRSTLSMISSGTPTPQAINQGKHKLLEEIFIIEVHITSDF